MNEEQELYEVTSEDGTQSCIIRTPTFLEFESAFTDAFEFTREFDLGIFSEKLIPICYVEGDRIFDDEESLYFISQQMETYFLQKYFIEIPQLIVNLDGLECIKFEFEGKIAHVKFPDFKTVRYLKNEALKKRKLIEVCKMIFVNNLIKEKSDLDFLMQPQLLLICGMSILQYVKTKEFTIKKK